MALESRGYGVLGPSKSGKTMMVGALQIAARNVAYDGDLSHDIVTPNKEMMQLLRTYGVGLTRQEGLPPVDGTLDVCRYSFSLRTTRRRLFGRTDASETRFELLDGPGASLLPQVGRASLDADVEDAHRERLLSELSRARGFILCVDPTNPEDLPTFFVELPALLEEVIQRRQGPLERVVVCLTKADKHFHPHGPRALSQARASDPVTVLRSLMAPAGLRSLELLCRKPTQLGVCWTSVFGFAEGAPNFNPQTGGLRHTAPSCGFPKAAALWQPFQVLDPFVFAATGKAEGVVPMPT